MSEPQAPAPPTAPLPTKKKTSPWVWVGVGCLVLLLLVLGAMGACGLFVAKKAKEVAADFEQNPAMAAAEMAVRLNPELELVASDPDSGKITVRNKATGEEMTVDFEQMAEGRISFETAEGESSIAFDAEEGGVTIAGPEGETRIGAGASNALPGWIPSYPGASSPEGTFSSTTNGQRSGGASFRTSDPVARVLEFYERSLKAAGMEASKTTFTAQGSDGGMLTGSSDDPERTVSIMVSDEDGETNVAVSYSDKAP